MSLKAKQMIIALLSMLIVLVLFYVIYTEKEHRLEEHRVIVKADSAGCVRCHGYKDKEGGPGRDPAIVKHWEASVHVAQGVGCIDCHGLPPAGDGKDILNPRYVVNTTWDKPYTLSVVSLD